MTTHTRVPLGEICKINPRTQRHGYASDTLVSFVPMAAVDEQLGAITIREERSIADVSKGYTPFQDGDVLFAKITPCMENGKATIARDLTNGMGSGSTEFYVLRPDGKVLGEYIYHFVRQPQFRETAKRNFTGTAGQQRVPKSFMEDVLIPLPPLAEQRRIVNILNRAAKIERLRKQAQERLREFIPALFVKMFGDPVDNPMGWEIKPLKDLLALHDSGVWGPEDQSDGISVLRSTNFKPDGSVRFENLTYRHIDSNKRRSKILLPNDIILEKSGGGPKQPVGRVCLFRGHQIEHTFGNFTARLRADRSIVDPEYLFQVLRNFHLSGGTLQYQKYTSGIRNLETNRYFSHPIPLPPLYKQKRFAKIIQAAQTTTKLTDSSHKTTMSLTASLMSRLLEQVND